MDLPVGFWHRPRPGLHNGTPVNLVVKYRVFAPLLTVLLEGVARC